MKIKILKDCEHTGIKVGEVYEARPYCLDPSGKFELLARVTDGRDPHCTTYRCDVEILKAKEKINDNVSSPTD